MTPPFDLDVRDRGALRIDPAPPEIDLPRTTLGDLRLALDAVEHVLAENEPKHRGAWRRETVFSHLAHCRAHCESWVESRRLLDIANAATRALFALQLALTETQPGDGAGERRS